MTGKWLRANIKESGFELKKVAELIGITPQDMNSKLKASSLKADFIEKVAKAINKDVYGLMASWSADELVDELSSASAEHYAKTEPLDFVEEPRAGSEDQVTPDPQMPGIYGRIIEELIESSKAQRSLTESMASIGKSMVRISDALLEERVLMRDTAAATKQLAERANDTAAITASLERIEKRVQQKVEADQMTHMFLASHIAALEGRPVVDLTKELHNAMTGGPTVLKKSKTAHVHK